MPRVSYFHGIAIYMHWHEGSHAVAHFHAHHAGMRASIDFAGQVLAGEIDAASLRYVREWVRLRQAELEANWDRARKAEPITEIEPLA